MIMQLINDRTLMLIIMMSLNDHNKSQIIFKMIKINSMNQPKCIKITASKSQISWWTMVIIPIFSIVNHRKIHGYNPYDPSTTSTHVASTSRAHAWRALRTLPRGWARWVRSLGRSGTCAWHAAQVDFPGTWIWLMILNKLIINLIFPLIFALMANLPYFLAPA